MNFSNVLLRPLGLVTAAAILALPTKFAEPVRDLLFPEVPTPIEKSAVGDKLRHDLHLEWSTEHLTRKYLDTLPPAHSHRSVFEPKLTVAEARARKLEKIAADVGVINGRGNFVY